MARPDRPVRLQVLLSLRFNREDGERLRKVAARCPRRHNESLWNIPISCAPFADRSSAYPE
jgi:hypothetical protein